MTSLPPEEKKAGILRLRAGLLLLIVFVVLCATGGHFIARQFGLGIGWALLLALGIWVGVGILLARMGPKIYFGTGALITLFLGYLVFDFCRTALDWSDWISLVWAVIAAGLVVATFYDFRKLKHEIRVWIYSR